MANINRIWCIVIASICITIVIVVVVAIFTTGDSNSASSKIFKNNTGAPIVPGMFNETRNTNIRIWPTSLPKAPKCGLAGAVNKIIGGQAVEFDEHQWTALLDYQYDGGITTYDCGGTLINAEYVLTAAHCLTDSRRKLVGVLLGEQDVFNDYDCYTTDSDECANDKPKLYSIAKIIIHPRYNDAIKQNDIALIKLNETVEFNEIIKPVCLPNDDFGIEYNKKAFAVGWGLTNSSDKGSESNVKKIVSLPVWNREECKQKFNTIDTQICAGGEEGKDSCTYDSGGPLLQLVSTKPPSWTLVGIVSYGFNGACGVKDYPGVYTNVAEYMDWILEIIAQ